MIVNVDESGSVALTAADDFKRFHVVASPSMAPGAIAAVLKTSLPDEPDHVYVSIAAIRDMAAGARDADWESGFAQMLEFCGEHGWLSEDGTCVKAHRRKAGSDENAEESGVAVESGEPEADEERGRSKRKKDEPRERDAAEQGESGTEAADGEARPRRRRRRRRRKGGGEGGHDGQQRRGDRPEGQRRKSRGRSGGSGEAHDVTGMFVREKGGFGTLRMAENQYIPSKQDVFVPKGLVERNKLRDGAIVEGRAARGQGKHKYQLLSIETVDGKDPKELGGVTAFKNLVSIDPDFHYEVGDASDDVSMRILDVICPVGRGTRGLIVAPPRSGKTILLQQVRGAPSRSTYPDVHVMVLLVDERPEEATEWQRTIVPRPGLRQHQRRAGQACTWSWPRWSGSAATAHGRAGRGRGPGPGLDHPPGAGPITTCTGRQRQAPCPGGHGHAGPMERPQAVLRRGPQHRERPGSLTILGTTLIETGSVHGQGDLRGVQGHRQHGARALAQAGRPAHLPRHRHREARARARRRSSSWRKTS